jgi:hypothetical protein
MAIVHIDMDMDIGTGIDIDTGPEIIIDIQRVRFHLLDIDIKVYP